MVLASGSFRGREKMQFLESMQVSDWLSLITTIATAVGVYVVWKQTQKLSDQLMLQNFSDYTKRYQEIILNFPEDINEPAFTFDRRDDYAKTMRYMRAYLDLCYEEWLLNQRKLIDGQIWVIWSGGMKTAFSKQAFRQAWVIVKNDTRFGSEFELFIDAFVA